LEGVYQVVATKQLSELSADFGLVINDSDSDDFFSRMAKLELQLAKALSLQLQLPESINCIDLLAKGKAMVVDQDDRLSFKRLWKESHTAISTDLYYLQDSPEHETIFVSVSEGGRVKSIGTTTTSTSDYLV